MNTGREVVTMGEWKKLREELNLSEEDEKLIEMEMDLIKAMIRIREEQGLSQTELAEKSQLKQPAIARMEKNVHSPQVDSLLKVLVSMGYTLQIVPINK